MAKKIDRGSKKLLREFLLAVGACKRMRDQALCEYANLPDLEAVWCACDNWYWLSWVVREVLGEKKWNVISLDATSAAQKELLADDMYNKWFNGSYNRVRCDYVREHVPFDLVLRNMRHFAKKRRNGSR